MTDQTDSAGRPPLGRREILGLALCAGVGAVLTGCSGSSRRQSRVGDPIPDTPGYTPMPGRRGSSLPPRSAPPSGPGRLTVVNRATWASQGPIMSRANRMGRVEYITVHHDGMNPFTSTLFEETSRRLESIRRAHVNQEWADIGYHFAVDPAGRVWEGRPESLQGAHVKDRNPRNLGIVVLGNFEKQRPTDAALRAIDMLVASKMDQYGVPVNKVMTHREWAATACPGRHLQSHMQAARDPGGSIRVALDTLRISPFA